MWCQKISTLLSCQSFIYLIFEEHHLYLFLKMSAYAIQFNLVYVLVFLVVWCGKAPHNHQGERTLTVTIKKRLICYFGQIHDMQRNNVAIIFWDHSDGPKHMFSVKLSSSWNSLNNMNITMWKHASKVSNVVTLMVWWDSWHDMRTTVSMCSKQ